jgi:hypothetical protein
MTTDMMERLAAMMGGEQPKPKTETPNIPVSFTPVPMDIGDIGGVPKSGVLPDWINGGKVQIVTPDMCTPAPTVLDRLGLSPVVVLDDGSTFSNLERCRVCFVAADTNEINSDDLADGVLISDLMALRDLLRKIIG